jgi:4-hydroxybenzoate polyprenyltransferase
MARSLRRVVAFLRCSSCRFAALYFSPFCGGLVETARATVGYAALGAVFWLLHSLGIEVTNRLADRTEDAINRPERTALCALVGWGTLRSMQSAIWCTVIVLDIAWILLAGNPLLIGLLLGSSGLGIAYSRGLRLSRSRSFSLITLNLLFGGAFLLGWSVGDPLARPDNAGWNQLADFLPLLVAVGLFILALAGIKDITDRQGDIRIGYRSFFVDIMERRSSAVLGFVASVPFLAILAFVLSGLLPTRLLALIVFAPVSTIVVSASRRAQTRLDRMLVREAFYDYWLVFSSSALLLFLPRAILAEVVLATIAYWILATRWLHWGQPLGWSGVVRIMRIASPGADRVTAVPTTAIRS